MKTVLIKCELFHLFSPIMTSAEVKLGNSRLTSSSRASSDFMWSYFFAILHSLIVVESGQMIES
jgi:hypothetical protein